MFRIGKVVTEHEHKRAKIFFFKENSNFFSILNRIERILWSTGMDIEDN